MTVGSKVVMNNKYFEYENHKGEVFEVTGFGNVGGTEVAYLKDFGCYALDGLTVIQELKPCPFCGSKPILKEAKSMYSDMTAFYVRCDNYNCPVTVATCNRDTPEEAFELWNTRAQDVHR